MTNNKLNQDFFNRSTLKVAPDLLGKYLIRNTNQGKLIGKITETEAYVGPRDKASHAHKGRTPRTETMFSQAGTIYVYLIYGMYYCLNIVTEAKDYPAAVLIRAVEPLGDIEQIYKNRKKQKSRYKLSGLTNGPGKLCQGFKIDKSLNNKMVTGSSLYILDNAKEKIKIGRAKRIGIDYAEEYREKLWRFYIK